MTLFIEEPELLESFRAADAPALTRVYQHYARLVEASLQRRLRSVPRNGSISGCADLVDILQETFVKAFADRARNSYDASREYGPYLIAIAHNTLMDHLRGSSRELLLRDAASPILLAGAPAAHDDQLLSNTQRLGLVDDYVAALEPRQRTIYIQRYVRGYSQERTAAVLGMSRQQVRTVESRLHRGLVRLLARSSLAAD